MAARLTIRSVEDMNIAGQWITSLSVMNGLGGFFAAVGFAGAVLAVLCALAAAVALAAGASGFAGGAVGGWIPSALLSSAACFTGEWMPLLVSLAALAVAMIAGTALRGLPFDRLRDPEGGTANA